MSTCRSFTLFQAVCTGCLVVLVIKKKKERREREGGRKKINRKSYWNSPSPFDIKRRIFQGFVHLSYILFFQFRLFLPFLEILPSSRGEKRFPLVKGAKEGRREKKRRSNFKYSKRASGDKRGKKNCARIFVPLDRAAMAEKESASALVSASRAPLPSLSFTVTITLALAPVPFPAHDRLIDRITRAATKRPTESREK